MAPTSFPREEIKYNHITGLPAATLSIDHSNRSPGFLNFQLTKIDHLTLKVASGDTGSRKPNRLQQFSITIHRQGMLTPGFTPCSYMVILDSLDYL